MRASWCAACTPRPTPPSSRAAGATGYGAGVVLGDGVAVALGVSAWPGGPPPESDERSTKYAVIVRSTCGVTLPLPVCGQMTKGIACPATPNVLWKWLTHQPPDALDVYDTLAAPHHTLPPPLALPPHYQGMP